MSIVKIQKTNLVDEVYRQMCDQIQSGQWKEGEKIASEHKLCELFNVSRVVIREALQRLRTQGLIVTRHGMGSFVSNPRNFILDHANAVPANDSMLQISENDFLDFLDFRNCIEFRAIELSVTRATAEDYARISSALQQMKNAVGDLEAYSIADLAFHTAIIDSAHNIFFSQTIKNCQSMILFCFREMNRLNDSQTWGIELHRELAEYIIARDAKTSIRIIKKNNDYNFARLSSFFQSHPFSAVPNRP